VANLNEAGITLPGYMLRATCFPGPRGPLDPSGPQLPCPTPDPYGSECLGRGKCRTDVKVRVP
jgi:hypothetical protein